MTITNLTATPRTFNSGLNSIKKNQNPSFKAVICPLTGKGQRVFVTNDASGGKILAIVENRGNGF